MKRECVWTNDGSLAMDTAVLRQCWSMLWTWVSLQWPLILLRCSCFQKKVTEGPAWAYQSQGPCDKNQKDDIDLVLQQTPHLHQHQAQGGHGECQPLCGGPGQVHEDFQTEEAHNGSGRVFFTFWCCSIPNCRRYENIVGGQTVPGDWATAIFSIYRLWQTSLCPGVWRWTWLTPSSPRRASLRPWRGSAELSVIRMPPPPSGSKKGAVKIIAASQMDLLRKARNRNWPNYNHSFFIRLFRKLGKHTTYQEVLEHHLLFWMDNFKCTHFLQDGAPCHTSKRLKTYLATKPFQIIDWPGNSPDLNPIENLWNFMKVKLKTKDISSGPKLIREIKILWTTGIPQGYCLKLSNSMPRRIQQVLVDKGEATKYWKPDPKVLSVLRYKINWNCWKSAHFFWR